MDSRTGYIYGTAEATERNSGYTSAWTTTSAVDSSRMATETKVFEKLVGEVEKMWAGVVRACAAGQGTTPVR